jgi:S-adenosyl methyltransferase
LKEDLMAEVRPTFEDPAARAGSPARPVMIDPPAPAGVDPTKASPARLYDYFLGGTNNFAVDREIGDRIRALLPELTDIAWANRGFHQRAALWLAKERGIRQFIDLGSGLPTQGNTHEVVQRAAPGCRVVYVDYDPMVTAHAAELLTGNGDTAVVGADMRDPDTVLGAPALRDLIDFSKPVGLLLTWVLHFLPDSADPWGLVRRYVSELASGSYVVVSHGTWDRKPIQAANSAREAYGKSTERGYPRTREDIERFFEGLELVPPYPGAEPRVAFPGEWGAEDPELADSDGSRWSWCGVARRP